MSQLTMTPNPLPIYLFADSQLFFWSHQGTLFMDSVRQHFGARAPVAAYVGASNGDLPEAYSIFVEAMKTAGVVDFRMVRSSFPVEDQTFLGTADMIVLAGGDVEAGWKVFHDTGMKDLILKKHSAGALLIGVSAGAVQLGTYALIERSGAAAELIDAFRLVPFIIGAHDEKQDWKTLQHTIQMLEGTACGIGISSGGGLIYHPDGTVEAIRHPLSEFSFRDAGMMSSLIYPPAAPPTIESV